MEPGACLVFNNGTQLSVQQSGALTARGTAAAPIRFSGAQATAGYGKGIGFVFSNSTSNQIDFASVCDAGRGGTSTGAIYMDGLSNSQARLSLTNSALSNSQRWCICTDVDAVLSQSGNTFGGCALGNIE